MYTAQATSANRTAFHKGSGILAAHAKPSIQTTATVGASKLARCQRRTGEGASNLRVTARRIACGLARICGTHFF